MRTFAGPFVHGAEIDAAPSGSGGKILGLPGPFDFFSQFLQFCPFPEGHPQRPQFLQFASMAAETQSRISARLTQRGIDASSDAELFRVIVDAGSELYDFWAALIVAPTTYVTVEASVVALDELATWTSKVFVQTCPSEHRYALVRELPIRLAQRQMHWTAECHRYARAHALRASAASEPLPEATNRGESAGAGPIVSGASPRASVIDPLLAARGWSRAKWAAFAGVDPSVVYDYLAGTSTPRAETRKALADALGIPLSQLPE